jgi:hypothetical protein
MAWPARRRPPGHEVAALTGIAGKLPAAKRFGGFRLDRCPLPPARGLCIFRVPRNPAGDWR